MRCVRTLLVVGVAMSVSAGVGACSGDAPVSTDTTIPFRLSVASQTVVVPRAYNAFVRFQVQRDDAHRGPVNLVVTGMPSFASAALSPSMLDANTDSGKLTVDVGPNAPLGNYYFEITASAVGELPQTVRVELIVPTPTLSMKWADTSVVRYLYGNVAENIGILLNGGNGFRGPVTLQLTGLPAGIRPTWFDRVIPEDVRNAYVGFSATTVAPGSYPITVTASGEDIATVSSTIQLIIQP